MQLDITPNSLPVYEALASNVRLQILQLISERDYNITEQSESLGLSQAIITKHIQKLEETRLIHCKKRPGKSGVQKIPHLAVDTIDITFPTKIYRSLSKYTSQIPLGHYTNFEVMQTCGLATKTEIVGKLDDPLSFVQPDRVNASLLWFSEGFVEYKIPNALSDNQTLRMIEISMEIASEFPYSNNVWPSDITFLLNQIPVGTWTCPGNFSDVRGFYTPDWWDDNLSQYGLLKHLRINENNCTIDGEALSRVSLSDLHIENCQFINFRIQVAENAQNKGGVTLFGNGFGNHAQDIIVNLYYS